MSLSSNPAITCWDQTPNDRLRLDSGIDFSEMQMVNFRRVRLFVEKTYTSLTHLDKTLHKIRLTYTNLRNF